MIIRGATLYSRAAAIFAILFALAGCGGGGGNDSFLGDDPADNVNASIQLVLLDSAGNVTTSVETSATLQVTVLETKTRPAVNVVVNASTTIGQLAPATGTALTDANGVATFSIFAGDDRGAGSISASSVSGEENLEGTLDFQVGVTGLKLGSFDDSGVFIENQITIEPSGTISQGGSVQLAVDIVDADNQRVTSIEEVTFTSGCIGAGQATINPINPVASVSGRAATLYSVNGCAGFDEISASLPGTNAQALGTLDIAPASAQAILFVSAEPTLIVLKGTGGENRDETSDLIFQVIDNIGSPLPGVNVNFSLSTEVGGITLSKTSALSDGDGQVRVTVASGDVATAVRVIATILVNGQEIVTTSDLLTVTTGLPDANSISLSVATSHVIEGGLDTDGLERELTVRMADKFNNPVVDGTAAVFTTEYGAIVGSCNTVNGSCSVTFTTTAPRFPTLTGLDAVRTTSGPGYNCPSHNANSGPCPDDLGPIRGGRSTILVHAIGEESFVDANGNGIMDQEESELFDNLPEAYVDHNEDGVYTPGLPACMADPTGSLACLSGQEEIFVDFNSNDVYDFNDDPAVYNGLLCPPKGDGVWCSRSLLNVWDEEPVIIADDVFQILLISPQGNPISVARFDQTYTVYVADIFNNPPSTLSSFSISTEGDCELVSEPSIDIPDLTSPGAFGFTVQVTAPTPLPAQPEQGRLRIGFNGDAENSFVRIDCETIIPPDPNDPTP